MQPRQIAKANELRSDEVARRTKAAIGEMQAKGERISFYSVAKRAQVARSTLYRRLDLRRLVEEVRGGEAIASPDGFDVAPDIERLKEELANARRERDEAREAMEAMRPIRYRIVSLGEAS